MKEGKKHGKGIFNWSNGKSYTGEWVNNKRHGKGVLCVISGDKYENVWVEDKTIGEYTRI